MRNYKKYQIWNDVKEEEWNDWHWQVKNRITDVETLQKVIDINDEEKKEIESSLNTLRMAITPYYASLMDYSDRDCPIRKQAVPTAKELNMGNADMEDPLAEDVDSPVPGLTHRYPDRVLLLVTEVCSMYCRHCTRRRRVGETDSHMGRDHLDEAIAYIEAHEEVRDVVVSGGDPLTMSD